MAVKCEHWKEYDSISGPISYCEISAFGKKLTPQELEAIGCTEEKRKVCGQAMEFNVGAADLPLNPPPITQTAQSTAPVGVRLAAATPITAPVETPIISCDPPKEVATKTVGTAEKKAVSPFYNLLILGILAGAYIGLGAELSTMITNDLAKYVGDGFSRLFGGMVFSLGLILVVIGGAELFTGNVLMVTGWLEGKIKGRQVLRNWAIVYCANFIGAIMLAWLFYNTGLWKVNNGLVGAKAVLIANTKVNLTWSEALVRGILCNWLVCLAVWLASANRDGVGRILSIIFPVTAFVASGFEHSIANMYFIPEGLFLKAQAALSPVLAAALNTDPAGVTAALANLTWNSFIFKNLVPVTIGNIIGGGLFVGALYWSVFLRAPRKESALSPKLAFTILSRIFSNFH